MKTLQKKWFLIGFIGTVVLMVSACAPPPLEVFLSPNPDFEHPGSPSGSPPTSAPVITTVPEEVPQPDDEYRIASVLSETLAEAQAHVHAGEARLQEQNLLEAVREFEQARMLLEERVDPALQYIQHTATIQGGVSILSEQRIQRIRNQRVDMLSRINRAYDFQTLYAKQRELDRLSVLREGNRRVLQPLNVNQQPTTSRVLIEERPKMPSSPVALRLSQTVSSQDVEQYISRFQQRQNEFSKCLERTNQYFPTVTAILSAYQVPEELIYVALIESGFQPSAESSSGKAGLWQLSRSIARAYGIEVSSQNDERKDIEASTRAFARYVSQLHKKFGSWELGILAYEMGEQNLQNTINQVGSSRLQDIEQRLGRYSREREFLVKLAAAMTIADNPRAYGFDIDLPNISSHQVTVSTQQPLKSLAAEPPAVTLY